MSVEQWRYTRCLYVFVLLHPQMNKTSTPRSRSETPEDIREQKELWLQQNQEEQNFLQKQALKK